MIKQEELEKIQDKYKNLENELNQSANDKDKYVSLSKEYADLNEIIKEANSYYNYKKNKEELEKLLNDDSSEKEIKEIFTGVLCCKKIRNVLRGALVNFI